MKLLGFTIKPGLIVTLVLGALIWIFQYELLALVAIGKYSVKGRPNYCLNITGIRSLRVNARLWNRANELKANAKLIATDPPGIDLYRIERREIWTERDSDITNLTHMMAEQEYGIYDDPSARIRPGDVVLDGGANIGLFTKHALELGASLVVAIEPVPAILECLRRNLKEEIAQGRVIVCPKGIWNKNDFLEISIDPKNMAADSFVLKRSSGETLKLPLTTTDQIVQELKLERIDFIKMDIEGSEREAISGASQTIRHFRPRMAISSYHLKDDPIELPRRIQAIRSDYRQICRLYDFAANQCMPEVFFYF